LVKFGTAGIRGIYGEEVSVQETLAVCYAVNKLHKKGTFGVCRDTRRSSVVLSKATVAGINWFGSDVFDFGLFPTPLLAFNVKKRQLEAGLAVTASHNTSEYAGIKVFNNEGIELSLVEEHRIEEETRKANYSRGDGLEGVDDIGFGECLTVTDGVETYFQELLRILPPTKRKMKILVDCANGAACHVSPRLVSSFGHVVISINSHPSHSFPGRHPEPNEKTLKETSKIVRAMGDIDLAVAHDGDADRVVLIDHDGCVIPDYVLSWIFLKMILEESSSGSTSRRPTSSSRKEVTLSVNSSNAIVKLAIENGCKVNYARLGKTPEELYRKGSGGIFASEPSKIVDPRWGFWEDGIYTVLRVVQHLSSNDISFESMVREAPVYYQEKEDIQSVIVSYEDIEKEAEKKFEPKYRIQDVIKIDGIKFVLRDKDNTDDDDSWIMFRNSGTENKVRIYAESRARANEAANLMEIGKDIVKSIAIPTKDFAVAS
jgi:phosphomannomutase